MSIKLKKCASREHEIFWFGDDIIVSTITIGYKFFIQVYT